MKVNILSKELILDDFFKIEKWIYQYEKDNGEKTTPVDRLVFQRQDSAAAILYNIDTQKVILAKQFRHCTYEKGPGWMLEIMAGRLDEGEEPEDALKRESIEEIGYKLHKLEKVAMVYASPGCSAERMFIYYAEVNDSDRIAKGGGLEEEGEYIEVHEMTVSELQTAITNGDIIDAKTVIAANYFLNKTRA